MEYLIGLALAGGVAGLAASLGFDRDRSFAPTALIVIAAYYVLFAVMGGSSQAIVVETCVAIGFLLLGVVGFKTNPRIVAAAIIGHGLFDFVHGFLISNPGMPAWWPGFCGAIDVALGGWLMSRRVAQSDTRA